MQYRSHGIRHLVALRGDLPSGARRRRRLPLRERPGRVHPPGNRRLVPHRRRRVSRISPAGGAARATISTRFRRKVDAGADSAITQYFYNADAYWHFVDDAAPPRASTCRSFPASCRSAASRSSPDSPTRAAPRFRAGSGRRLESFGDDTRFDPRVRARRRHGAVRRPARARRARPALLHAEPGGADDRPSGSGWGCSRRRAVRGARYARVRWRSAPRDDFQLGVVEPHGSPALQRGADAHAVGRRRKAASVSEWRAQSRVPLTSAPGMKLCAMLFPANSAMMNSEAPPSSTPRVLSHAEKRTVLPANSLPGTICAMEPYGSGPTLSMRRLRAPP